MSNKLAAEVKAIDKKDLRYLWYLPVYILAFVLIERVNIGAQYHEIHMFLDDLIPFSEYFVVPYLSWHVLTFVVIGYLLLKDPAVYRKMMTFFIVATILCFVIFLVYPSYQTLRPDRFARSNVFTWVVSLIYAMDTPTNICPSMHVIGSLGLLLAVFETKEDMRMPVKTVLAMLVVFICASTMFLKQHSVVDVVVAMPVSFAAWALSFVSYTPEDSRKVREALTRKSLQTVPNAMSLVQILLVPVAARLYLQGSCTIALIAVALAGLFDVLDGPVARKTGQVTDAGKILDAAAHKIMHYTLVILLVPGYHWLWLLLILMMLRDLTEIMCGYLLFSRYDRVYSSRWFGRLVTIALYAVPGLIMAWTGMPRLTADALIIACAGLVLHAFFMQIRAYLKVEWGTQYRTYSSEVIRTITMSIWVMAVLVALTQHDTFTVSGVLQYTPSSLLLAAAVMMLLFALKTLSIFFYSGILFTASGTLFSPGIAVLINLAGAFIMILEGYFLGKTIGGDIGRQLPEKHPKLQGLMHLRESHPFVFVILIRMLKVINYDLGSMYFGAVHAALAPYLLGSLLGMLPEVVLYALIGSGLGHLSAMPVALAGGAYIGFSLIAAALLKWLTGRYNTSEGSAPADVEEEKESKCHE